MSDITFADLGLGPKVEAAVSEAGYTIPTPIQAAAIPVALTGRDVLGIAQTGTGKTASFTLPMISLLERGRARARMPRSLILAPTRELAAQVAEAFEKYGANHKLLVALLIGGVSFDEQLRKLDRGADVLIATPGRMLDHFQRGKLLLTGVEILVIDEADRMLDMGFVPDIERICKLLPPKRQTLFFSATMPNEIQRLVDQFLRDPEKIEASPPASTAKTITQRFKFCPDSEDWAKREELRGLLRSDDVQNAIVFCNRKRDVAILLKSLTKHGFNAGALHGDMDQSSRMATLAGFRSGEINILAASDVAARGLDIPAVSHVFNFDVPWAADDYVHRIGRTGRAGREGNAATLVGPDDLKLIAEIQKITGEEPVWIGEPPTEDDYAEASRKKKRRRGRKGSERGGDDAAAEAKSTRRGRGGRRSGQSAEANSADTKSADTNNAGANIAHANDDARVDASETVGGGDGARARKRRASAGRSREARESKPQAAAAADPVKTVADEARAQPDEARADAEHEAPQPVPSRRDNRRERQIETDTRVETADAFAGQVPAFLQRPVRRKSKSVPKEAAE